VETTKGTTKVTISTKAPALASGTVSQSLGKRARLIASRDPTIVRKVGEETKGADVLWILLGHFVHRVAGEHPSETTE